MSALERVGRSKSFGGWTETYEHRSAACQCRMRFAVYLPPQAASEPVPVLYWLSGLTCTEENFITKAGVQAHAAAMGMIVVAPDTSPRGAGVAGEDEDWDLGTGAGFYVDATEAPWSAHYNMYRYVTEELPSLVESTFPIIPDKRCISGHSMGGHGALIVALKNPGRYRSVSAFAPICAPSQCPWGEKAFTHYLGDNPETWKAWDATALLATVGAIPPTLIDQGLEDPFLHEQLHPHLFEGACNRFGFEPVIRRQAGYDHSYYFISSFLAEHLAFHRKAVEADCDHIHDEYDNRS